jgi:hypothetical protein
MGFLLGGKAVRRSSKQIAGYLDMYEFPASSRVQHPSCTGAQSLLADPVTMQCRYTTHCVHLGPTLPPIPGGEAAQCVKLTTRLPCNTTVKNEWSYTYVPPIRFDEVERDFIIIIE